MARSSVQNATVDGNKLAHNKAHTQTRVAHKPRDHEVVRARQRTQKRTHHSAQSPSWEVDPLAISKEIHRGIHPRFHVIFLEIPVALALVFPFHAPSQKETISLAQTLSSIPSSYSQ